jgi:hypothetical protein
MRLYFCRRQSVVCYACLMRVPAQLGRTVACLAISAGAVVGSAVAQAPDVPANPYADVPPVTLTAHGRSIRAHFLGGSWETPSGQLISSAPPCCVKVGRRQTLALRSGASFDVVLREPVARVRVYPLTGGKTTRYLPVMPDAQDPLRWHVRTPRLRRGSPTTATNIEVSYRRGVVYYRFNMGLARLGE